MKLSRLSRDSSLRPRVAPGAQAFDERIYPALTWFSKTRQPRPEYTAACSYVSQRGVICWILRGALIGNVDIIVQCEVIETGGSGHENARVDSGGHIPATHRRRSRIHGFTYFRFSFSRFSYFGLTDYGLVPSKGSTATSAAGFWLYWFPVLEGRSAAKSKQT